MAGKLHVVGFGPGGKGDMTQRAIEAMQNADIVIGYTTYVKLVEPFFPGQKFKATGMMKEVDRCRMAVQEAMDGKDVAMISSGDSGIYGMAGIIYQVAEDMGADIEIDTIPGITAASSAASVLGAPLMHDTALISLSDLMTPIDLIMKRIDCVAQCDMIICLYNPKSKGRTEYLDQAVGIVSKYRAPTTPVGIVRNSGREDETHWTTTLGELDSSKVDMFCMVIIGNSQTYVSNGRMITPRGYKLGE